VQARARLLDGIEARQAATLLSRKHPFLRGLAVPLAHRLARYRTLHHELTLTGGVTARATGRQDPGSSRELRLDPPMCEAPGLGWQERRDTRDGWPW
jgi:hypothetical protein